MAIHMDRVAGGRETLQSVDVEPRQVHVLGYGCDLEGVEPSQDASMHPRVDARF